MAILLGRFFSSWRSSFLYKKYRNVAKRYRESSAYTYFFMIATVGNILVISAISRGYGSSSAALEATVPGERSTVAMLMGYIP
jgi:uncharacterized protein involved in propanediol utilization